MDPENPIVRLCVEGMRLEGLGRTAEAQAMFRQAWEDSEDDFDACIAAHYLARHQPTLVETLQWNQEALRRAESVGDERVRDFFPSLYLNLGYSYEQLGDLQEAEKWYKSAAERAGRLPEDRYGTVVRGGIEKGLLRTRAT